MVKSALLTLPNRKWSSKTLCFTGLLYITNPSNAILVREIQQNHHTIAACFIPQKIGSHLMTPVFGRFDNQSPGKG